MDKYLALLLIFNAVPAALVATAVSIVTCWLLMEGQLLGGWPVATASIYVSFFMVLFFLQRLWRLVPWVPQHLVFLDKLCIAQHEEHLKMQGVRGLAGFLTKSDELIILWSPRTFSRVWCTFELACFIRESAQKPIRFVPVSMARLLWLASSNNLCLWLAWLVWLTYEMDPGDDADILAASMALGIVFILGVALQTHFGIQQMKETAVDFKRLICSILGEPFTNFDVFCQYM
eukprot:Skav206713  [mRNA]  locus=scaffold3267:22730:23425:+ [translate_table: standard]